MLQHAFIGIYTADSFTNTPSGLGIIFSLVPASWRPGCLPFILGNVPFLLPFPPAFPSAGLKDVSHFFYLAPTNPRRYSSTVPVYAADEFLLIS